MTWDQNTREERKLFQSRIIEIFTVTHFLSQIKYLSQNKLKITEYFLTFTKLTYLNHGDILELSKPGIQSKEF